MEKGAIRAISTGTENVNVGSSKTDVVAEKIESKTCRPSTSTLRDERDDLVHSASGVKGPPRPRWRWACVYVEAIWCKDQLAF